MTNLEFGQAVGCHRTTASAYRNGRRLPGVDKLERIRAVLGITHAEVLAEHAKGAESFGALLRDRLFDDGEAT